ncbi:unnamed protein product [Clonostachys byssicola]|uniref:Uncharacterized protein n=1 Tax=Clonostachys byssicola TaxID=160290 RepID=A0A9N9UN66_9HYPO|nr:unnamed protein product [Clonostachys byssicola]
MSALIEPENDAGPAKDVAEVTVLDAPASDSAEDRAAFFRSFTPEEHKRAVWKVDIRILWLSGCMMVIKNLGSANAANARVMQSKQPTNIQVQLGMSDFDYNWVSSIFYIALIICEIPSNLMLKYWKPRNWLSRIMATWGIVVACHAAMSNKEGYYVLRFVLGAMEAGLFPGIITHFSSWYRNDELEKPIMWMLSINQVSGIASSMYAYGVSYMDGMQGLSAWQWLFILEGITTVLFAGVVFLVLPDYPGSARSRKWLTPREQTYLELRLMDTAPKEDDPTFNTGEVFDALRDPRTYLFSVAHFCLNLAQYALSWQLPTITTSLGFVALPKNQLLNIPPCLTGIILTIIVSYLIKQAYMPRPAYVIIIITTLIVFFGILAAPLSNGGIYAACIIATGFTAVFTVPFFAWRASSLKGSTGTAFTTAFQLTFSQAGGVIAPQLFQAKYSADHYRVPFSICTAFLVLSLLLFFWCWWTTRQLESEINRVRRLRIKAAREGRIYDGVDAQVEDIRTAHNGRLKNDSGPSVVSTV